MSPELERQRRLADLREAQSARPFVDGVLSEERESLLRRLEQMEPPIDLSLLQDIQCELRAIGRVRARMEQIIHLGEKTLKEIDNAGR